MGNDIANDVLRILGTLPDTRFSLYDYPLDRIMELLSTTHWDTPVTGTHTTTGVGEEIVVETTVIAPRTFWMFIDLRAIALGDTFTIRVYQRVDGITYCLHDSQVFQNAQVITTYQIREMYTDADCDLRVTIQRTGGADRAFPYRYNTLIC